MRKQLVYCLLACVIAAPLFLVARNHDGSLSPVWAKAKTVEQSTPQPEKEQPMASTWVVSGAGNAGYNGTYSESGTYNGKPCYKLDDNHWLSWSTMAGAWVLGASTGLVTDDYYGSIGAELPASPWNVALGVAPAPTVAAGSSTPTLSPITVEITSPEVVAPATSAEIAGLVYVTYTVTSDDGQPFAATIVEQIALPDPDNPGVLKAVNSTRNVDCLGSYEGRFQVDSRAFSNGVGYLQVFANRTDGYNGTGSDTLTVTVDNETGTPGQLPPRVGIVAPANGATVSGTMTVTVDCFDDYQSLYTLTLTLDGATTLATQPLAGNSFTFTREYSTSAWSDGYHSLTALATNVGGQTDTATVMFQVNNGVAADTTPPTVSITAPADGATVSGTVTVAVSAADNVGLARVELLVDSKVVKTVAPAGAASYQLTYNLGTANLANGSHTLAATATDTAGNVASTSITVTVSNATELSASQWVSSKASQAPTRLGRSIAKLQARGGKARRIHVNVATTEGATPEENYKLEVGVCLGGDWTSFDDCQTVVPSKLQLLREPCDDFRVAVRFTPLVQWDSYSLTDAAVCDHQVLSETRVLLMLPGPPVQILSWTGTGNPTTFYDLTGEWCALYTGVGFRVLGSRLYIAANTNDASPQPVVIVQDLDSMGAPTSAAPYAIELKSRSPHQATDIEIVGSSVYLATDNGAGDGHLWALTGEDLTLVSDALPGLRCLRADASGVCWAGTADGGVYKGTALSGSTGEAHVNGLLTAGTLVFALTGTAGKVFAGEPWRLFATAAALTEAAVGAYCMGRVWVAGNGGELYMYDIGSKLWQLYKDFAGYTSITQLVPFAGGLAVFGAGDSAWHFLRIQSAHLIGRKMDGVAALFYDV